MTKDLQQKDNMIGRLLNDGSPWRKKLDLTPTILLEYLYESENLTSIPLTYSNQNVNINILILSLTKYLPRRAQN